jgi:pimeloyl-ACP methyl ester carboxylesterase
MDVIDWSIGIGLGAHGLLVGALALFTGWTARRVEQVLPPLGRFIEVDGARLHYVDEGSGPVIVLIHGLAGQMRNFTHSLLERLQGDHRVIIVERPGSGYSTRAPEASAAIGAQAASIARFLDALAIERPLVVGHSMGGAVALALALNHPTSVAGLALLAPLTHPQDSVPAPFQGLAITSPLVRWLVAWPLAVPLSIVGRNAGLATIFGPQAAPSDFATKGGGLLGLRPRSFIAASRDLVAAVDDLAAMPARYAGLNIPVGILFGTGDRILDPAAHGEALAAKLPAAEFEVIDGGGHMILIASADRSAKFIARMAQRAAAGAKAAAIE